MKCTRNARDLQSLSACRMRKTFQCPNSVSVRLTARAAPVTQGGAGHEPWLHPAGSNSVYPYRFFGLAQTAGDYRSAPSAHTAVPDTATPTRPPSPEGTPIDQVVLPPTARTVSLKSSSDIIPALAYPGSYDPHWKLANFRFTRESLQRLAPMHALLDASNPDLSAFREAGGKVLIWHGLADPNITPMNAIAYWQAVRDLDPQADDMLRLFLIPSVDRKSVV